MIVYVDDNEGYFEYEKKWYVVMEIYQMFGFNGVFLGVGFISLIGGLLGYIVFGDFIGFEFDYFCLLIIIFDMMFNILFFELICIFIVFIIVNLGDWY